MRDPFQWSIRVGRWGGTVVRLHVFFLAFAVAALYYYWPVASQVGGQDMLWIALSAILFLFLSVLVHELGHALVAKRVGVVPDTITIGPLGGLTAWRIPADPRAELAMLVVGPLANLGLALLSAMAVVALQPERAIGSLFNPLEPPLPLQAGQWLTAALTVVLWINWLLFLINLLPAHPFDGGRILRAVLWLTRPAWSARRVAEVIGGVAVTLSVLFAAMSAVLAKHATSPAGPPAFPLWSVLLLLAIVLLVSARREILDVDALAALETPPDSARDKAGSAWGSTSSARAESLEPPMPSWPWEGGAEERADLEEIEAAEERQVDGILSRLHAHGMHSLTADERRLLDRVSARYRSRLGKRS